MVLIFIKIKLFVCLRGFIVKMKNEIFLILGEENIKKLLFDVKFFLFIYIK